MQNFSKQNEMPFELAHFQVEELEERFENCWQGKEEITEVYFDGETIVEQTILVDC